MGAVQSVLQEFVSMELDRAGIRFDPNTYRITSVFDGNSLDVCASGKENGTSIITWTPHNKGKNQKWRARLHGGGIILSSEDQGLDPQRAKAIQVTGSGAVRLYDFSNGLPQKWFLEETEPGSRTFVIRSLANNACLRNNGPGKEVTAVLTSIITPNHVWRIDISSAAPSIGGSTGGLHGPSVQFDLSSIKFDPNTYRITSLYDGSSLDMCGHGNTNGTNVITYSFNGGKNQRWKARLHAGGVILSTEEQGTHPQNAKGMQLLTASGIVVLYDYLNTLNQKWYLEEIDHNSRKFVIRNLANNACLQNNGRGKQVTAEVTLYPTPKHIWQIDRL